MYCLGQTMTHPGDRAEGVGARSQMGGGAQELKGVTFFGDWVAFWVVDVTDERNFAGLYLDGLTFALGFDQGAADRYRAAGT